MIICSCAAIGEKDLKERALKHWDMFGAIDPNNTVAIQRLADAIWEDITMDLSVCNSCIDNDNFFFNAVKHIVVQLQSEKRELIPATA